MPLKCEKPLVCITNENGTRDPMSCRPRSPLTLTHNAAATYPRVNDTGLPPYVRRMWSSHLSCLPNHDALKTFHFNTCAIVGGAIRPHERRRPSGRYDAVFRVGYSSRGRLAGLSGTVVNVQWLSDPIPMPATLNIYVTGSVHQNIARACKRNSYLTHPIFKENDAYFPNVTKRDQRATSMHTGKSIYNPSLGFFAIRLGMHMCRAIRLYLYDLHVLDPNAVYRGGSLVKEHHHNFVMERRVISKLLRRCKFGRFDEFTRVPLNG